MAQWLVTQGSNQYPVAGMGELQRMARSGDLKGGDMIQPPGTSEWMYVVEVPELRKLVETVEESASRGVPTSVILGIAGIFGLVFVVGAGTAIYLATQLPSGDAPLIGEGGLQYSQMLVTDGSAVLQSEPSPSAPPVAELDQNQSLELLSKRGSYYRARAAGGAEGWVGMGAVIPMYQLGDPEVKQKLDPLYNPDKYVLVSNASWTQPIEQKDKSALTTVFNFMIENQSDFAMSDVVLQAAIKDAKGHEIETLQIPVQGVVPPRGMTMIGMLMPETPKGKRAKKSAEPVEKPVVLTEYTFMKMSETDPDLQLRYVAGAEVEMSTPEFTNATITLLELRAIPDEKVASAALTPAAE